MILSERRYQHGSLWALWRWKDMFWNNELYLRRLILFQCPLFSVFLHWFHNPDTQDHLHDHPVNFFSIILWGSYLEERKDYRLLWARWINFIPAKTAHRIIRLGKRKPITLCFAGRRIRDWGFHTPNGWVHWKEYESEHNGQTT